MSTPPIFSVPPPAPEDCSPVTLSPTPGFTVKSVILQGNTFTPPPPSSPQLISSSSKTTLDDLQQHAARKVEMLPGMKVFLNVAWEGSGNMPAPPEVSEVGEDAIRKAMRGEDGDVDVEEVVEGKRRLRKGVYFVPVAVTGPREERDKAGKPSLVFDCVFSSKIKSRTTKDKEFKTYIVQLAIERVEEKAGIELSRQIGTPNIASKGKLLPRAVLIPNLLLREDQIVSRGTSAGKSPVPATTGTPTTAESAKPKGILKGIPTQNAHLPASTTPAGRPLIEELSSANTEEDLTADDEALLEERRVLERLITSLPQPRWQWTFDQKDGVRYVKFTIEVPKLTRDAHLASSLNVEDRRVLLLIPGIYGLDINLELSDAQIGKIDSVVVPPESLGDSHQPSPSPISTVKNNKSGSMTETLEEEFNVKLNLGAEQMRTRGLNAGEALRLKKWVEGSEGRELNVEDATAEWYIQVGKMAIWA